MHRIDSATATADKNGPGKTGFTGSGDPLVPATQLTAKWFNAVQEEIAYIIESAGLTLSDANTAQLFAALLVKFVALDANNHAAITASAGNNTALTAVGSGTSPGILTTGGATNGRGVQAQGSGSGAGAHGIGGATGVGVEGVGGSSSGAGVTGVGTAGNARGVQGQGQGSGAGAHGTGGGTSGAIGVHGVGGASNGVGVRGDGVGTGAGGYFDGQGDGSAATDDAIELLQNIKFSGAASANGNIGYQNRLTKKLFPKAVASFVSNGATVAIDELVSENVSSISVTATYIEVTLVQAMVPGYTAYFQVEHCPAGTGSFVRFARAYYQSNTKIRIEIRDTAFAIVNPTTGVLGEGFLLIVWGVQ